MRHNVTYRRGSLQDLSELSFADGLAVRGESIEFNVVGMGHEFWIAIDGDRIVGLTVVGKTTPNHLMILYLQVAPSHQVRGIGSAMLRAIIESYPERELSVVPFEGTEEFYFKLGFEKTSSREMRRPPSSARFDDKEAKV